MLGRRAFALICACMCALGSSAQPSDDDKNDEAALSASGTALDKGHYLAAQEALTPRAFDAQGKPRDGMVYSHWSLLQTFIANEPAPAAQPWSPTPPSANVVAAIAHARLADPIAEIVRRARSTRIVILNEDHWVPRDRAFALQVARALRPLGYDVLAAETFQNSPQPPLCGGDAGEAGARRLSAPVQRLLYAGSGLRRFRSPGAASGLSSGAL